MEDSLAKAERAYVKLIMGALGLFVIFVLLCWGGFRFYRQWEEGHLLRRANAFMGGGDLKMASLTARRALQLDPSNVEVTRLIAQILEKAGDRTALDWRRNVIKLNPNSTDDVLALVRCALWLNDVGTAEKALTEVAATADGKPDFHAASGRLAEIKKDMVGAEAHWARAVELAPNDTAYRFQLALTRLSVADPSKREQAFTALEGLRTDASQRARATRILIIDAVAHRADPQRIRALASELQDYPDALFSDRIMFLEILRQMQDPSYGEVLARMKTEVPAKPSDLATLLSWMIRNRMNAEAIEYATCLSSEAANNWPVPLAIAEAYAQSKDWVQLEKWTGESSWAGYDFLRHAYLSRAFRGQDKQLAAEQELNVAQTAVAANPQMLSTLTQTIADWGWQNEAVDLLWALTKNPETKMQALQTLYEHYTKISDTSGLYRTLTKFAEINPTDMALQNNLAQVSLLLGADVDHARRMAAELAEKEPTNATYLSTYAFALLCKGDIKGALQVMSGLSAEQLRDPSIATYYGIVLSAAGEKDKAKEFLHRSSEASLLPEEKALVVKAENGLN